jgi:hypothetical protein
MYRRVMGFMTLAPFGRQVTKHAMKTAPTSMFAFVEGDVNGAGGETLRPLHTSTSRSGAAVTRGGAAAALVGLAAILALLMLRERLCHGGRSRSEHQQGDDSDLELGHGGLLDGWWKPEVSLGCRDQKLWASILITEWLSAIERK